MWPDTQAPDDPATWARAQLLFDKQPENVKMWIDFWAICDERKAHLFFTSHAGWMWRSKTSLDRFSSGWTEPRAVLRGDLFAARRWLEWWRHVNKLC